MIQNLSTDVFGTTNKVFFVCPSTKTAKVVSISIVNNHTAPVKINLFKKGAGIAQRLYAKNLEYSAGAFSKDDTIYSLASGESITGFADVAAFVSIIIDGEII